ncbi:MAG: D-alanine--D-alanine ligase family protein [Phycisphaerales bacterium]
MEDKKHVLVLGGGPDAEREVSIKSATAIAGGLRASGRYEVTLEIIDRPTAAEIGAMPGGVVFPYLHGPWGEGGGLQDLLESSASGGRPFVGSGSRAARAAMDKVHTKMVALEHGIATAPCFVLNSRDSTCPTKLPVVVKPVHEGSTIGLHVCASHAEFGRAVEAIQQEERGGKVRAYMVEPKIGGDGPARELTVGVINGEALPIIEIRPKGGLYDYEAKYNRNDTEYVLDPEIPEHAARKVRKWSVKLAKALGVRHISRADYMLDSEGMPWLLEINTTPGFTDHSLVPKAAAHAGIAMPDLCSRLVEMALA